ncbi:MAG: toxin TcdB middle/N-terminal domain-containing protein, partial [Bacteroidota bacterium]
LNPSLDTILTRARLTFKTPDDQALSIEDSIPELDFKPALKVTSDFKVNIAIEALTPENGNFPALEGWYPAIHLMRELAGWPQDSLDDKTYVGFSPEFYYDTTEPTVGDISITVKSPTSIEVCWSPPSKNTDSIILEVKDDESDDFVYLGEFSAVTDTCFLHTGLDSTSVYSYRIRAVNGNGESGNSLSPVESTASHRFTKIPGTTSGYTPVDAQVNESGGVSASVPITIPTGTSGMQPELTLSVHHNSGEPYIGGLSVISRVAPTYAQDGIMRKIQFGPEDRFTIDGERLIVVSGSYGAADAEYRTEQETFQHIVSKGGRTTGPTFFEVKTKDGLKKYYGNTENSKIEIDGNENKTMHWLLNKVEDVFGNYYTISYIEDTENGFFYPQKIEYTGNDAAGLTPYCEVRFEYENRPDVFKKFVLGDSIKRTQRLKSIKAYYQNDLVRKYDLSYSELGFNSISHLGSVTEYGSDGSNFASTVFHWKDEENTIINSFSNPEEALGRFNGNINPYSTNGRHERFIDMNNDGKSDYVFVPAGRNELYVAISNGTGFEEPTIWLAPGSYGNPYSSNGEHENFADFNGDNYPDYAWVPNGRTTLWVALGNEGNSFHDPQEWLGIESAGNDNPYSTNGQHEFFIDFNSDGRSDYIFFAESGEDWFIAKSVGDGFEDREAKVLIDKGDASGNSLISNNGRFETFIDINNDGYLDFVYRPDGRNDRWAIKATGDEDNPFEDAVKWLSEGAADGTNPNSVDGKSEWYADVNGDGLPDWILRPGNTNKLFVALSNGKRLEPLESWLDGSDNGLDVYSTNGNNQLFADVNRDGLADFLYYPNNSNGAYVAYSTGSSFASPQKLLDNTIDGVNTTSSNNYHDSYADINGDGIIDKVWVPAGRNELYVSYLTTPNPLLASVTNGHGLKTEFNYKPLTDSTVYDRGNDAEYPYVDFQAPIYVVSEQTTDDGIGGRYSIQYKYYEAQLELEGRGFRGYGKTENIDLIADRRSIAYFNRDFRHVGTKVERSEEYAGGVMISEMVNELAYEEHNPDVFWSYVKNSTHTSYELDGTLIKSVSTGYQYDDYGNPTRIEVNHGGGFRDITENV